MRYEPRFVFLPLVWTVSVVLIWLVQYDAWAWPVQFVRLAAVSTFRFGPHVGWFVSHAAAAAGCVGLLLLTAFGVGASAVGWWVAERSLFTGLMALAAGLWMISVAVLLVGVFSVAATPWVLVLGVAWVLPWPRQFIRAPRLPPMDGWMKLMVGFLVLAALLNLLGALTPPFEYDELEYHLGSLADYRRAGRIVFLPHNFYSNLPQLTEMLYLVGSDTAAKLLHWSFGVLTALALYAVANRLWAPRVAMTAAALFYCLPFVQDLSMTARVDLATTFFAMLAFGALLLGNSGGNGTRFSVVLLAALAAGAAVATKWTAVPVVWLPCAVAVAVAQRSFRSVTVFCLVSAVLVIPWLLKNWLLAGNPVYPLWSHSPHWSAEQAALFAQKHYARFDGVGWWQFFERLGRYALAEPGATPLLLLAAPLALFVRPDRATRHAAWLLAGGYVAWYLLTFRPWRFLFPAFPLAAMVGAVGLCATRGTRGGAVAVMGIGLTMMGLNTLVDVGYPDRVPPRTSFVSHAMGNSSREEFVSRMGAGSFEPVLWMNEHLPPNAKVLYLGEGRAYYARHAVVWATAFDRFPPGATNGVTHVYVNFPELKRLRENYGYPRGLDLTDIEAHLGREIHRTERGAVFEWKR